MPMPPVPNQQHTVLQFAADVGQGLVGLIDRVGFMTPEDTAAAIKQLHADRAGLEGLELALIAHAERVGVPAADACTSMEAWLRTQLLLEPREARRQVKLARRLDQDAHEPTREALGAGKVDVVMARIILEAVDALPEEVEPAKRTLAETHLINLAQVHDAGELRGLAKHIAYVVDPEGADQRLAEALARAEAKAVRTAHCRVWFNEREQSATGQFKTDLLTGRKLARMFESLMNPARPDPIPFKDEEGKIIAAEERRGQALIELVDRISKKDLPQTGGCDPVVVVTMTLETLTGGLKAAVLDTGERLAPGVARRLAARHGVIPVVLGTGSEVLDVGRKARLGSRKQRLAMNIQQHGRCAVEGCDRPITWADAHHLKQWRNGGRTDLANMVMPCRPHHRMADHPDYRTELIAAGRIRIARRP